MIKKVINTDAKVKERQDISLCTLFLVVLVILIIGCGKKENEIPAAHIPGIRAPITKILISPLAFDGAIVAVEGIAHDVKQEKSDGQDKTSTIFKLSDLQGNYINVSTPGKREIFEYDYLVVGGIYRRAQNLIEAQQIEIIVLEEKK